MVREVGLQWKFMLRYKIIILRAFWSVYETNPQRTISFKVVIQTEAREHKSNSTFNFRILHKERRGYLGKACLQKVIIYGFLKYLHEKRFRVLRKLHLNILRLFPCNHKTLHS